MDHPRLLEPGFHDINLSNFNKILVDSFTNTERRKYLSERFHALIDKFKEVTINAEVWVDGSYTTFKQEPNDIDVVFFIDYNKINDLPLEKKRILSELNQRHISKIRYIIRRDPAMQSGNILPPNPV